MKRENYIKVILKGKNFCELKLNRVLNIWVIFNRNSHSRRYTFESKHENEQTKQINSKENNSPSDFKDLNVETVVKPAYSSQLHSRTAPLRRKNTELMLFKITTN